MPKSKNGQTVADAPFNNGINALAEQTKGRVEITDRKEFNRLTPKPSIKGVKEIEELEEVTLAAEQRLGTLVVG